MRSRFAGLLADTREYLQYNLGFKPVSAQLKMLPPQEEQLQPLSAIQLTGFPAGFFSRSFPLSLNSQIRRPR